MIVTEVTDFIRLSFASLKDKGRLVLVTPNSKNLGVAVDSFWHDPGHKCLYPLSLLSSLMVSSGFEVIDSGIDKRSAPRGLRSLLAGIRRLLVGDYFTGPDVYIVAEKPSA
jgi:hypothetical protein